jgi:hypothetical protein
MKIILTASGLLDIVDGTSPKPEPTAANYAAWNSKNAKAMCILSSAIEYLLEYLITCENAVEMWDKLSSIHEQKSAANKLVRAAMRTRAR